MTLYSWGANSYGQLGLNHKDDKFLPFPSSSKISQPEFLTGGGGHTLVIIDGAVYSCGSNSKGQLGVGHKNDVTSLEHITTLSNVNVMKVSCGWDYSLGLSDKGNVYSWGSNAFGQLACADLAFRDQPEEICIEKKQVKDIACGLRHSIFLTETGEVLCCGAGRKGQLGCAVAEKLPAKVQQPTEVVLPSGCGNVIQTTAGAYHSVALTDKGHIIVWGDNKHGQCCVDPGTDSVITKPRLVPQGMFDNKTISHVYSGWTHLLAKAVDGTLFSWGRNDYGQLGRPCSNQGATFDHTPKTVPVAITKQVACGSEHNIALLETGMVMSWGWNEHGMCGSGNEENILSPKPIETFKDSKVCIIGSGHGHSLAFTTEEVESR